MRSVLVLTGVLMVAAPAIAGPPIAHDPLLDQKILLGSFTLQGGQSVNLSPVIPPNNNDVVGFSISFDYDDTLDALAWASDLRVLVTPSLGAAYSVGGFTTTSDEDYTWYAGVNTDSGFYSSGPHYAWELGVPKGGNWTFNLANDYSFNGDVAWNNVSITLHKVPEPGSLGLLGLGALALIRRRR